jgi:hypothetical protein
MNEKNAGGGEVFCAVETGLYDGDQVIFGGKTLV